MSTTPPPPPGPPAGEPDPASGGAGTPPPPPYQPPAAPQDPAQPPPPPMYQPPAGTGQTTSLPVVSLILGIVSWFFCPLIAGIAAIITGVSGRKKARELGQPTGMATAGMWLGIISSIAWVLAGILFVAVGGSLFKTMIDQAPLAEEATSAYSAAERYYNVTGTYNGLSEDVLRELGYVPDPEIAVTLTPEAGGQEICVEASRPSNPGTVVHVPPRPGEATFEITINSRTSIYANGPC